MARRIRIIFLDVLRRTGNKYSEKKVMAFLLGTVYSVVGILDATTHGVSVHDTFYWVTSILILGLIATRSLTKIAAIKEGITDMFTGSNSSSNTKNNEEEDPEDSMEMDIPK